MRVSARCTYLSCQVCQSPRVAPSGMRGHQGCCQSLLPQMQTDKLDSQDEVWVCSGSLVPGGSVLLNMQFQLLNLSSWRSPPHMCYPVVLPLQTPWVGDAFRRGFRRVPRSLDSVTHSDVTTWANLSSSLHRRHAS